MSKKAKLQDIKALRGIGHQLSPIVIVGANGLTPTLIEEVARALHDHELIKIKIPQDLPMSAKSAPMPSPKPLSLR